MALKLHIIPNAYPSLFILNSEGKPVVYYAWYLRPGELIEFGKAGLKNL